MKVVLLRHTPDPDTTVALSARLCYSPVGVAELQEKMSDEDAARLVRMLVRMGHFSPIEHVTFTFAIEGVSSVLTHQLVRHRIASYSQKSQRYVNETQFEYVTPPVIKEDESLTNQFDDAMKTIQATYDELRDALIKKYKSEGMDEKDARKKANEDARFVLPNACTTSIIVTMNIRSLFNFFKHRCCNRAQWEIRAVAKEMYKYCFATAPNIFKYAGPACYTTGSCSEGKMTCGKATMIRNEYDKLKYDVNEILKGN
jgi:thymidylate synthase (FAD)